jgi:mannobiose 2-epimerase
MDSKIIGEFKSRVQKELDEDIVPFWSQKAIDPKGGFIGRMNNDGVVDEKAPKGLILNTRILWTFSTLYVFEKKQEHLTLAKRAYDLLWNISGTSKTAACTCCWTGPVNL